MSFLKMFFSKELFVWFLNRFLWGQQDFSQKIMFTFISLYYKY